MGETSKQQIWVSWLLLICAVFYFIKKFINFISVGSEGLISFGLGAIIMFSILIYSVVSLVKFYKNR